MAGIAWNVEKVDGNVHSSGFEGLTEGEEEGGGEAVVAPFVESFHDFCSRRVRGSLCFNIPIEGALPYAVVVKSFCYLVDVEDRSECKLPSFFIASNTV